MQWLRQQYLDEFMAEYSMYMVLNKPGVSKIENDEGRQL